MGDSVSVSDTVRLQSAGARARQPAQGRRVSAGRPDRDRLERGQFHHELDADAAGPPVKFANDEPICMLVPQKRSELEIFEPEIRNIESDPDLQTRFRQWMESRNKFVAEQKQKGPPEKGASPWQGHYTRGTTPTGEAAREHQVKLKLRSFIEREPRIERAPQTAASHSEVKSASTALGWKRFFTRPR